MDSILEGGEQLERELTGRQNRRGFWSGCKVLPFMAMRSSVPS